MACTPPKTRHEKRTLALWHTWERQVTQWNHTVETGSGRGITLGGIFLPVSTTCEDPTAKEYCKCEKYLSACHFRYPLLIPQEGQRPDGVKTRIKSCTIKCLSNIN